MTNNEEFDSPEFMPIELPPGAKVIVGAEVYKIGIFRAVTCPDSSLVLVRSHEMMVAFDDLETWALPINPRVMNQ